MHESPFDLLPAAVARPLDTMAPAATASMVLFECAGPDVDDDIHAFATEGAMRMATRKTILLACVAVLIASSSAFAQRWGRGSVPREGACFYNDVNFRGEFFCLRPGDDFASIPDGMNDRISSLRLFGRTEVMVFKDSRFSGRSAKFNGDVRNMRQEGWNDLVSSIRVGEVRGRGPGGRSDENPDRIVRRAYQDILAREPDPAGMRLYRSRIIDDDWTEADVREALRKSPEYRDRVTMTPARAQDIVRQAYLSVLGREPDGGSRGYIQKVLRDHWSQQDVERELRRSPEYRSGR
jgi:hypothetical protein